MKVLVLAGPGIQAAIRSAGHDVVVPNTVRAAIKLAAQERPEAAVVYSGADAAEYMPLGRLYARGMGLVALAGRDSRGDALAAVVGALGGAVLRPAEGRSGFAAADILAALSAVTGEPPEWLPAVASDPMFAAAVDAALEHGGLYSSRLLQKWLHADIAAARALAKRLAELPGAMPPTQTAPGVLRLPGAEAQAKGVRALLAGKFPIRRARRARRRGK